MGRLSGYTYKKITKKLESAGFVFWRQGKGSHEIWHNRDTDFYTMLPKHSGDMPEGTLRSILKHANIDIETFLEL